jgi:RNA recognition motif-containing protein
LNIYVGNLPFDIKENEVRQELKAFGMIASIRLKRFQAIGKQQQEIESTACRLLQEILLH